MKITKKELVSLIRESMTSTMESRSIESAILQHPKLYDAIENLVLAVDDAIEEFIPHTDVDFEGLHEVVNAVVVDYVASIVKASLSKASK